MREDLIHLKVGDKLAVDAGYSPSHVPKMRYQILEVTKVTATQLVCGACGNLTKRFRREDGGEVGQHFRYAVEATPEILAEYDAQLQVKRRWQKATEALDTLIDKPLHKLGLDTDQLEKLAEAWVEVQKMKVQ